MPTLTQISGWKPWYYAKTIRNDAGTEYRTASAPFPPSYLPARAFWAETFAVHCEIVPPWAFLDTPFDGFMLGGGASGTLIGSLSGLAIAELIMRDPSVGEWGIGRYSPGVPDVGYCMGQEYKEHTYFHYSVLNLQTNNFILGQACQDVFQRSRLKRIYVCEGMVVRFVVNPSPVAVPPPTPGAPIPDPLTQYVLTIDYEGVVPEGLPDVFGDTINIYKKDGTMIVVTIVELLPNWEMVVTLADPDDIGPESGDFYQMNTPWCVEDPYMMSGFWQDPDTYGGDFAPRYTSTLYSTTHIYPYDEIEFVGNYVYKEKDGGTLTAAAAGSAFIETETHEWQWEYYTGIESEIYGFGTDRYFWIEGGNADDPLFAGDYISPSQKKFVTTSGDLPAWKDLEGVNYARLEINKGGSSYRHNWQAPILTNCWLNQGGKYFAILGQPDGNVIDVALRDVTDSTDLSTGSGDGGTILNQYAWMINEHFTDCRGGNLGFLEGEVTSSVYDDITNETTISFLSKINSYGTIAENYRGQALLGPFPNSFYNRFVSTFSGGALKDMWIKFGHWRVYDSRNYEYYEVIPSSVVITPPDPLLTDSETPITVTVNGDMSDANTAGFYFDKPYSRIGQLYMPIFTYSFTQALKPGDPLPWICVDMSYRSAVMEVDLPNGTRVGSCGATYWGLGIRGNRSVWSDDNLDLFVTVPFGPRGISSFFHYNRQQDWIFFQDADTNRLTLRTGNLDYTETPRRAEVVIGFPESIDPATSFPITFDTDYDRVKLITMKLPPESDTGSDSDDFGPAALTFQIDSYADYFGFKSTGSGVFDFQALRDNGFDPGTVDYSTYKNKGSFLSPVYLYKKRTEDVTFHDYNTLELGIPTTNRLFVKNGTPSDIKVEYIKDNQTLENIPLFDVHHIGDGEIMTVYGDITSKFDSDGTTYDPRDEIDPWPTQESVFMIGSADNALTWGTPMAKMLEIDGDNNYQYPVLLLNACNYLSSYYNEVSERLVMILKCYFENSDEEIKEYIGCLTINKMTLTKDLKICVPEDDDVLPFWLRDSRIPIATFIDPDKTYTLPDITISGGIPPTTGEVLDSFYRVAGHFDTSSQIEIDVSDMGLMAVFMLNPGTTVILYSSQEGVRMLAAHDMVKWGKSEIILARNGESPFFIGENLFYLTSEGITMKANVGEYMYWASQALEGAGYTDVEIERIQEKFDLAQTRLIGSGKIDSQRISVHVSHVGTYKVLYYNTENILSCLESKDTVKWRMANNF